MTQTLALLLDSYRELNAKRLFWIVLILSGGMVALFGMVGQADGKVTIFGLHTWFDSFGGMDELYKFIYSKIAVKWWLSVGATSLALISTAGTFPDLMASGSIDLYLSKPVTRAGLFFTKYLGGLLFAALQVTVFAIASFLLLGFRAHTWQPSIFLAIPIVVAVFSYLFSILVFMSVVTRSTIASLLITFLLWFAIWGVQFSEFIVLNVKVTADMHVASLDKRISSAEEVLANFSSYAPSGQAATTDPYIEIDTAGIPHQPEGLFQRSTKIRLKRSEIQARLEQMKEERAAAAGLGHTAERVILDVMTALPKTDATTDLLVHKLNSELKTPLADDDSEPIDPLMRGPGQQDPEIVRDAIKAEVDHALRQRTAAWVLGTSFLFEGVVLALACWLFCRRDY